MCRVLQGSPYTSINQELISFLFTNPDPEPDVSDLRKKKKKNQYETFLKHYVENNAYVNLRSDNASLKLL